MKRIKKMLGLLLGFVMLFSLAACSQNDSGSETDGGTAGGDTNNESGNSGSSDDTFIAFANKGLDYYFWTVCQKSAEQACVDRGWSFEASDAKLDSAKQFDQFVNFINKKPAAIIADSIDSEGLIAAADQAVAAGIRSEEHTSELQSQR